MRLIILSAFGGRLISEPMEWPDEPLHIRMPISQPRACIAWSMGKDAPMGEGIIIKHAVFERTDKYQVLPNKRTAAIYELVGL